MTTATLHINLFIKERTAKAYQRNPVYAWSEKRNNEAEGLLCGAIIISLKPSANLRAFNKFTGPELGQHALNNEIG